MDLLYNVDTNYSQSTSDAVWSSILRYLVPPQRYVLTILGFLGLVNAYAMRLSLSVAITQMVPPPIITNLTSTDDEPICPYTDENYIHEHLDYTAIFESLYNPDNEVYDWSQEQQGIILSSFYWGYFFTQIPGGLLSQRYGGKYVLIIGIFFSAICSCLTPIVVQTAEATGLIALRILMGLGQGIMYAAFTNLLAAWVPLKERTTLASFGYSGSTIGTIGGTYLAAHFIHKYNSWHQVFYFFGWLTIGWCLLFMALCYNKPDCHPFITDEEKKYLRDELGQTANGKAAPKTPWRQILTSVPFIALILCQISHEWAFCIVVLDLPKYMNDILHFSIQDNGLYSSIPQLIKLIMALVTGALSDWLISSGRLSITNGRKIFLAVASIFTGVFIVAGSYAECNRTLVVIFFAISVAFQGVPGVAINSLDLSPNYASILMGISGTVSSITGILVPYIVGIATQNSLLTEWRLVFWITFILQAGKLFIFTVFGSGKVQPWDSCGDDKLLPDEIDGNDYGDDNGDEDDYGRLTA